MIHRKKKITVVEIWILKSPIGKEPDPSPSGVCLYVTDGGEEREEGSKGVWEFGKVMMRRREGSETETPKENSKKTAETLQLISNRDTFIMVSCCRLILFPDLLFFVFQIPRNNSHTSTPNASLIKRRHSTIDSHWSFFFCFLSVSV